MSERNRGADQVMRQLAASGVETVFTLSGNHIMSLFDAAIDTGARLIHTRHEAAAVHMADAYGRLTGKPGVALVTGGPGHANASGALFTARGADSPMVLLSGHAPASQAGWAAFQELDQAAMAAPVAKASWTIGADADIPSEIARALSLAASGRPGPVHVSLPSDLIDEAHDGTQRAMDTGAATSAPDWSRVAAAVANAKRPVIIAGPAFARDTLAAEMAKTAGLLGVPMIVQESPRGLNDPSIGAFADVLPEADLVILANKACDFTVRFAQPPFWHPDATLVAISADAEQLKLASNRKGDQAILVDADAAMTLAGLARLEGSARNIESGWPDRVANAVKYRPAEWSEPKSATPGHMHPLEMCAAIKPIIDKSDDTVLIMDGGEIGQWAQANLATKRRITNSVTGSIGASLPFGIAARVVEPEAPVVSVMGDGTVGFHLAEFETAVRCGTPFVAIVGNDSNWNAEHQIQVNSYGANRAQGCELTTAAYHDVCTALGGFGALVSTQGQLSDALDAAIASGKPACINVMLEGHGAPKLKLPKAA